MLVYGNHHVCIGLYTAENRNVQRFGTVFCKNDSFAFFGIEKILQQFARFINVLFGEYRSFVSAVSRVYAEIAYSVFGGVDNSSRFVSACGGVVEIYHFHKIYLEIIYYNIPRNM